MPLDNTINYFPLTDDVCLQTEANMLMLTAIGKPENCSFTLPQTRKWFDNCKTNDELWIKIQQIIQTIGYPLEQFIVDAKLRKAYINKASAFYDKSLGFPIDSELMNLIYAKRLCIMRHACTIANQIYPIFIESKNDSIFVDKNALKTFLVKNSFEHNNEIPKDISQLKEHSVFDPIYVAYRTIQSFTGKSGQMPSLLNEDGYMKGGYRVFQQKTGRTSPKPAEGFILNHHPWLRHLVKPKNGKVFIAFDWSAQEQWVAAVMTGDEKLLNAYNSGDLYTAVGKELKIIPQDGSKATHPIQREAAKRLQLGITYGMGKNGLEKRYTGAGHLYDIHRKTFSGFWNGIEKIIQKSKAQRYYRTNDGWLYVVRPDTEEYKLLNAPVQAEAAALLRRAVMLLPDDIDLVCTLHDAFYINCDVDKQEETIQRVKDAMHQAAREHFNVDFSPRIDVKVFTDRYEDPRGEKFFNDVCQIAYGNQSVKPLGDSRLSLVPSTEQKDDVKHEVIKLESLIELDETEYDNVLSENKRQDLLNNVINNLTEYNSILSNEGFGKSFLTILAVKRGHRVVIACKSNDQAEEKEIEMRKLIQKYRKWFLIQPIVERTISKFAYFKDLTGQPLPTKPSEVDPFGDVELDDERALEILYNLSKDMPEIFGNRSLEDFYQEEIVNYKKPEMSNSWSILVTTIASLQIYAQTGQYMAFIPEKGKQIHYMYDDPGVEDLQTLVPYDVKYINARRKRNKEIERKNKERREKGIREIQLWPLVIPTVMRNGHQYFIKPEELWLGAAIRPFKIKDTLHDVKPKVIFTTTEDVTALLLKHQFTSAFKYQFKPAKFNEIDLRHNVSAGNVTIIGTKLVRASYHGIIPPMIHRLIAEAPSDMHINFIANGVGAEINLLNNKGRNDLKTSVNIIKCSWEHVGKVERIVAELLPNDGMIEDSEWTQRSISGLLMRDAMNQAIGRNSGYRAGHDGAEAIVLADHMAAGALIETSRYELTPWSGLWDDSKCKQDKLKRRKKLLEFRNDPVMSWVNSRIIELIRGYKQYVESGQCEEDASAIRSTKALKALEEALKTVKSEVNAG